jgi:hypothetical protein
VLDVLTVAVLAFVGVRVATGTRAALGGEGRAHVARIVRCLRPRHFVLAVPALFAVGTAADLLLLVPGLDWGWWSAIGGVGNPAIGGTERTEGTALAWIVPAVFLVLLIPGLPLFAEAEERMFRLGAEQRTRLGRLRRSLEFGLVHAIIGIPIGVALALSIGGAYFTDRYLRAFRRTGSAPAAVLESTRAHLAYNAIIVGLVAVLLIVSGGL